MTLHGYQQSCDPQQHQLQWHTSLSCRTNYARHEARPLLFSTHASHATGSSMSDVSQVCIMTLPRSLAECTVGKAVTASKTGIQRRTCKGRSPHGCVSSNTRTKPAHFGIVLLHGTEPCWRSFPISPNGYSLCGIKLGRRKHVERLLVIKYIGIL